MPRQVGTVHLFLLNEAQGGEVALFPLVVLLPDGHPPGPRPDCLFLGEQFLMHYDLRVTLDYPAIRYLPDVPGRRRLDSTGRCGFLEMF
jgi:hypothetical protein